MARHSSLASVRATRQRLAELGLATKKHLGQHFLIDDGVVGKILRLAAPEPGSHIAEIGPGIGTLTEALLSQQVELTAVEVDEALWEGLAERYPQLRLLKGDALDPDVLSCLKRLAPTSLVANLPYAVAATLILEYFQALPSLKSATIMIQREVAERIAAKPGSKSYGAYTVKLRLLADVAGQFKVSPQSFYPPPRVDSTVVRLERDDRGTPDELVAAASLLADAAFFQRRKTARNSMKAYFDTHGLDESCVDSLLAAGSVDHRRRGETLAVDTYLAMARAFLGPES